MLYKVNEYREFTGISLADTGVRSSGWVRTDQEPPATVPPAVTYWTGSGWDIRDEPYTPEPVEPVVTVPESVSRAQGKYMLMQMGLWHKVLAFVADIEDPSDQALADIALNDTQEWRRDSPFLKQCAEALELNDEVLDDLFIAAALVQL